jgi:hypothetical protein
MAGTYQHYLQQMLQKGFIRPDGGKRHPSIWVYSKGQAPYVKRIERFGGEDEFYSLVSDGAMITLDDKITSWEAKIQSDLRRWRTLPHGSSIEAERAASLIGLTGIRTKANRRALKCLFEDSLPKFGAVFSDPDVLMLHVEENAKLDEVLTSTLLVFAAQNSQSSMAEIENSLEFKAVRRMMTYAVAEVFGHALSKSLRDVERYLQEAIESGDLDHEAMHNKALHRYLDEEVIRDDLCALNWSIYDNASETEWVLPDCAILQLSKEGYYAPFLFADTENRRAIIMPITPRKALIGTDGDIKELDLSAVNDGAIACSAEFFLSSHKSTEFESKSEQIGTIALGTMGQQVQSAIDELSGFRTQKSECSILQLGDVNFQCRGIEIDESHAQKMANKLCLYLRSGGQHFDISRVKKVVVSPDIPGAYSDIEKADTPDFAEDDLRRHIWWTSSVDDPPVYTLYLSYGAAEALSNPDSESFDFVLNLLLQNMSHIHIRTLLFPDSLSVQEHLAEYLSPDTGERMRDISLSTATSFLDTFFGCQLAQNGEIEQSEYRDSLTSALQIFYELPLPNTDSGDTNNERSAAISDALEELMRCVARYIAVCHFKRIAVVSEGDTEFIQLLAQGHLTEWMHRLDFDLQRLRVNFRHLNSYDDVKRLQGHTERLLWGRGMVLTAHERGGWILPFADPNISFANIRTEMEKMVSEYIPENIAKEIRDSMKLRRAG